MYCGITVFVMYVAFTKSLKKRMYGCEPLVTHHVIQNKIKCIPSNTERNIKK
jgi:hypothetical protein